MQELHVSVDSVDEVVEWRAEELERAGYEPYQASTIAALLDIDLHRAVDLVKRGCDPALAVRILV